MNKKILFIGILVLVFGFIGCNQVTDTDSESMVLSTRDFNPDDSHHIASSINATQLTSSALDENGDKLVYWTAVSASTFTNSINGIACGNSKFVAVGAGGKMAYSTDGVTWTAVGTTTFTNSINGIAYGNGKFVAVGAGGKAAYSSDGITWTAVTNTTFSSAVLNPAIDAIAYGNGKFVMAGALGKAAYSSDGITWTATNTNIVGSYTSSALSADSFRSTSPSSYIAAITYGDGKFVAVGIFGRVAYSDDGITWIPVLDIGFRGSYINGITYGDGKFVAVGAGGKAAYSTDCINWTAVSDTTFGGSAIKSITYGNGKFVAVGDSGKAAYWPYSL